MSNLTSDELKEAIQAGVEAGIREQEQAAFWIYREKHHKHHEFIDSVISFLDSTRDTAWKTFVRISIVGILGIFVLGFIAWIKFKGG